MLATNNQWQPLLIILLICQDKNQACIQVFFYAQIQHTFKEVSFFLSNITASRISKHFSYIRTKSVQSLFLTTPPTKTPTTRPSNPPISSLSADVAHIQRLHINVFEYNQACNQVFFWVQIQHRFKKFSFFTKSFRVYAWLKYSMYGCQLKRSPLKI